MKEKDLRLYDFPELMNILNLTELTNLILRCRNVKTFRGIEITPEFVEEVTAFWRQEEDLRLHGVNTKIPIDASSVWVFGAHDANVLRGIANDISREGVQRHVISSRMFETFGTDVMTNPDATFMLVFNNMSQTNLHLLLSNPLYIADQRKVFKVSRKNVRDTEAVDSDNIDFQETVEFYKRRFKQEFEFKSYFVGDQAGLINKLNRMVDYIVRWVQETRLSRGYDLHEDEEALYHWVRDNVLGGMILEIHDIPDVDAKYVVAKRNQRPIDYICSSHVSREAVVTPDMLEALSLAKTKTYGCAIKCIIDQCFDDLLNRKKMALARCVEYDRAKNKNFEFVMKDFQYYANELNLRIAIFDQVGQHWKTYVSVKGDKTHKRDVYILLIDNHALCVSPSKSLSFEQVLASFEFDTAYLASQSAIHDRTDVKTLVNLFADVTGFLSYYRNCRHVENVRMNTEKMVVSFYNRDDKTYNVLADTKYSRSLYKYGDPTTIFYATWNEEASLLSTIVFDLPHPREVVPSDRLSSPPSMAAWAFMKYFRQTCQYINDPYVYDIFKQMCSPMISMEQGSFTDVTAIDLTRAYKYCSKQIGYFTHPPSIMSYDRFSRSDKIKSSYFYLKRGRWELFEEGDNVSHRSADLIIPFDAITDEFFDLSEKFDQLYGSDSKIIFNSLIGILQSTNSSKTISFTNQIDRQRILSKFIKEGILYIIDEVENLFVYKQPGLADGIRLPYVSAQIIRRCVKKILKAREVLFRDHDAIIIGTMTDSIFFSGKADLSHSVFSEFKVDLTCDRMLCVGIGQYVCVSDNKIVKHKHQGRTEDAEYFSEYMHQTDGDYEKALALANEPKQDQTIIGRYERLVRLEEFAKTKICNYIQPDQGVPSVCHVVTGEAGVGKSYWIKTTYPEALRLAPTGLAAASIKGQTIHSLMSIADPTAAFLPFVDQVKKINHKNLNKIVDADTIVIDEVYMVNKELFDYLSVIVSMVCNDYRPFGGKELICVGDPSQLTPISGEALSMSIFLDYGFDQVHEKSLPYVESFARLTPRYHNACAELRGKITPIAWYNKYSHLFRTEEVYDATYVAYKKIEIIDKNKSMVLSELGLDIDNEFYLGRRPDNDHYSSHEALKINIKTKKLPPIVLTKNYIIEEGLTTGYQCRLVSWNANTKVLTIKDDNGKNWELTTEYWTFAYAINIHKTQGLTMKNIDLKLDLTKHYVNNNVLYVALTRVRDFDNMRFI